MEPNHNNYQPSAELPQPQERSEPRGTMARAEVPATSEQATVPPQLPPVQQPLQPVASQPTRQTQDVTSLVATPASATNTLIADDVDLIEKEWVVKAKAIVAQTKDDPHKQNEAMNQVKADYLKKRYNKDLKISNES